MAIGLLQILNTKKYGELMTVIRYQFAFDIDMYPKTLNSAYELMQNHSVSKKRGDVRGNHDRDKDQDRNRGGRGREYRRRETYRQYNVTGM